MNQALKDQVKEWETQILSNFQDVPTDSLNQWNKEFRNLLKVKAGKGSVQDLIEDFDLDCDHDSHYEFGLNNEVAKCLVCNADGHWDYDFDDEGNKYKVIEFWEWA
jgi:hypothetical protein